MLQGLRQQFIEKDLKKETEFKQFLKDKAVIDEIVKQIEEEDNRSVQFGCSVALWASSWAVTILLSYAVPLC